MTSRSRLSIGFHVLMFGSRLQDVNELTGLLGATSTMALVFEGNKISAPLNGRHKSTFRESFQCNRFDS